MGTIKMSTRFERKKNKGAQLIGIMLSIMLIVALVPTMAFAFDEDEAALLAAEQEIESSDTGITEQPAEPAEQPSQSDFAEGAENSLYEEPASDEDPVPGLDEAAEDSYDNTQKADEELASTLEPSRGAEQDPALLEEANEAQEQQDGLILLSNEEADAALVTPLSEEEGKRVTYSYTGFVPDGAPPVPATVDEIAPGTTQQRAAGPTNKENYSGYVFSGWTTTDAAVAANGSFTMPEGDVHFTGTWQAVRFTLIYDFRGGSDGIGGGMVEYYPGTVVYIYQNGLTPSISSGPGEMITRPGYVFTGWGQSANNVANGPFRTNPNQNLGLVGLSFTIYACWNPSPDTPYRVEHWLVDSDDNEAVLLYDENLTGVTDRQVSTTPPYYDGYSLALNHPNTLLSGNVHPDGSLVLKVLYREGSDPNVKRTIHYNCWLGTTALSEVISGNSLTTTTVDPAMASMYNSFGAYFVGWGTEYTGAGDFYFALEDYGVNEFVWTYTRSGDLETWLWAKWMGDALGEPIGAHQVTYAYTGSVPTGAPTTPSSLDDIAFATRDVAVADAPVLEGYTFSGWTTTDARVGAGGTFTMPDNNVHFTGYWTQDAATDADYLVEHYLVSSRGVVAATPADTEELVGEVDELVVATPKTYTGYTIDPGHPLTEARGTVLADGSLVLKLYYVQKTYTVTFVDEDGLVIAVREGVPHGGAALAPADPARTGKRFTGWDKAFNYITSDLTVVAKYAPLPKENDPPAVPPVVPPAQPPVVPPAKPPVTPPPPVVPPAQPPVVTPVQPPVTPPSVVHPPAVQLPPPSSEQKPVTPLTVTPPQSTPPAVPAAVTPVPEQQPQKTFTITFVDHNGTVLYTTEVEEGGTVVAPGSPSRSGFSFTGWDQPSSAWTNVSADATVQAVYDDAVVTTAPINIAESSAPAVTPAEEFALAAQEQNILSIIVPITAPAGHAAWALLNLILTVLGVVFALVFFIARNKKRNEEEDEEERKARAEQAQTQAQAADEEDYELKRRSAGWIIGTCILAVVAIILFILTEDMRLPMVWVDWWTIYHFIIFVVLMGLGMMAVRYKKVELDEDEERAATTTT